MGKIKSNVKSLISTKGFDTTSLIDKTAFRGIQYNNSKSAEEAAKESKNYVASVQFPVITCNEDGSLTGTYQKDGETKTSHGYTDASINVNIATMSDFYSTLAKDGSEFGIDVDDLFAGERSMAGVSGVPMSANINVGGKTTFDIDAQALASVSAKQRNEANKGTGARKYDEDPSKARLSITLDAVKATVDGVGKVTKESLNKGLAQTATTNFIASNSERSVAANNGEFRNAFDKATLDKAGTLMTKAYEKAFKEVADALANGTKLDPVVSAKDGVSKIKDTELGAIKNVKLIDSKGVKAFVQNPNSTDTKAINADMRAVANVVEARANAYVAQAAYNDRTKLGDTAYNLVQATNFSVNAIGLKQTIDGKAQAAGVAILSPATAATLTPTGANATRLNIACKGDFDETKKTVGPTIFDKAESMAKESVIGASGRTIEQAREAQNKVIEAVKADVAKAAKDYDSIGKSAGKDIQAGK